jgi:hypothetical protein
LKPTTIDEMAENNAQPKTGGVPNISSTPMKIFGGNDAKRMSFDENMPNPNQYGHLSSSPLSSLLSGSPNNPSGYNPARRDSLKNMWHLQDFGTD